MTDWAVATVWDSPMAKEIAREISSLGGLYCGPASVGWIAAVWNQQKGRRYDYVKRLKDKQLFPDGPRPFRFYVPGFQTTLSELLRRETNNELQLSTETYYRYGTIHASLRQFQMPIILRLLAPKLMDGLHYVTLYKSEKQSTSPHKDRIQLYWQDNGMSTNYHERNPGLNKADWISIGSPVPLWGAKQVIVI